jgi:F0F1-type ATP synthase membrane subunit c/vacuolar-type H+-ATPase subunit K
LSLKRILGFAFLMSVVMYGIVVTILLRRPGAPLADEQTVRLLTMVFYLTSAICLLSALVLVRRLKVPNVLIMAFALCEVPAILGLMHALLSRTPKDFYMLAASSAVFILYFMFREG